LPPPRIDMSTPTIRITLDSSTGDYQPGDQVTGKFVLDGTQMRQVRSAELSVLWYTAGKGEEDMAVHYFERYVDDHATPLDLRIAHRFATTLPLSPLSYDGHIVKICWCVRVRLFMTLGQEAISEFPIRLGNVAVGAEVGLGDSPVGSEGAEDAR
jgi:hypothetical protein